VACVLAPGPWFSGGVLRHGGLSQQPLVKFGDEWGSIITWWVDFEETDFASFWHFMEFYIPLFSRWKASRQFIVQAKKEYSGGFLSRRS
jgi:hypothetical protein